MVMVFECNPSQTILNTKLYNHRYSKNRFFTLFLAVFSPIGKRINPADLGLFFFPTLQAF
jgi:hypothetical protein